MGGTQDEWVVTQGGAAGWGQGTGWGLGYGLEALGAGGGDLRLSSVPSSWQICEGGEGDSGEVMVQAVVGLSPLGRCEIADMEAKVELHIPHAGGHRGEPGQAGWFLQLLGGCACC